MLTSSVPFSLYNQCESEQFDAACRALADVYYEAARLFGRNQPTAIDALPPQDKVQYEEAVMNYLNEEGKI